MSVVRQLYGSSLALLTDLYQLTMAYAHWKSGAPEREAVFHLTLRQAPFGGALAVACGLDAVLDYLEDLHFGQDDLDYLAGLKDARGGPLFDPDFLDYLGALRFTGSLHAVPEGSVVLAHEPLLRVRAPVLQAQLIESALLNLVNFPTAVATKAARLATAAGDDPVLDFGLRKAHGPGAGALAARAAYIGGCAATANVLAGKLFGIPVRGTHAHAWIMAFDDELDAFYRYARALPDNCVFLVDTYDSLQGVAHAIEVGCWLRDNGHEMLGIRLDSGELGELARAARAMLDAAGFEDAKIAASASLDEEAIADLKRRGAPIALWGVGTRLTTAQPDAALDGVYKLAAIRDESGGWRQRVKLSDTPEKSTIPGSQQIRRYYRGGNPVGDWLFDDDAIGADFKAACALTGGQKTACPEHDNFKDLLVQVYRDGRRVYRPPPLDEVRDHARAQWAALAPLRDYPVALEQRLSATLERLRRQYRERS